MLSRAANNLFWMGRYLERADFTARLLSAAARLATVPGVNLGDEDGPDGETRSDSDGGPGAEWRSALESSGSAEAFSARFDRTDEVTCCRFLVFDRENPSSIASCLNAVRGNARSVRTALTTELWEQINGAWHELQRLSVHPPDRDSLVDVFDWTKQLALKVDGAVHRTMLRTEPYHFLQLGAAVERADNTARILDVKYHLLLPREDPVGGGLDYYQWATILREVSALTAYRWVYRDSLKPWLVADLLILNPQMPRSLVSAYAAALSALDSLAELHSRRGEAQRMVRAVVASFRSSDIDSIFQGGLHEFITGFLDDNARLSAAISREYLL